MKKEEFYNLIKNELNIDISDKQKDLLDKYCKHLIEYNKNVNITAIVDEEDIYLKHFYDSLTIVKIIDLNNFSTLLDIGSGGGFPGIVLKIFFPNLKITLLDSNHKKTDFQKSVIDLLELKDIEAINERAEKYYLKSYSFDVVVARAVAGLNILVELCIPFVKTTGYFVAMKANADEEILSSKYAIEFLGGKLDEVIKFNMLMNAGIRTLIKVKKISETKKGYPRDYSRILKKPLK